LDRSIQIRLINSDLPNKTREQTIETNGKLDDLIQ
jgi:hypothetical protein